MNGDDNCAAVVNADQGDFDEDAVGDACDFCPDVPGTDGDGCPALAPEEIARVRRIAVAIATDAPPSADVDVNNDGVVDVVDIDAAVSAALEKGN